MIIIYNILKYSIVFSFKDNFNIILNCNKSYYNFIKYECSMDENSSCCLNNGLILYCGCNIGWETVREISTKKHLKNRYLTYLSFFKCPQ